MDEIKLFFSPIQKSKRGTGSARAAVAITPTDSRKSIIFIECKLGRIYFIRLAYDDDTEDSSHSWKRQLFKY